MEEGIVVAPESRTLFQPRFQVMYILEHGNKQIKNDSRVFGVQTTEYSGDIFILFISMLKSFCTRGSYAPI